MEDLVVPEELHPGSNLGDVIPRFSFSLGHRHAPQGNLLQRPELGQLQDQEDTVGGLKMAS